MSNKNRNTSGLNRNGRIPGSKNLTPARAAFAECFEELGGVMGLSAWAKDNPTDFYKLYARLIPSQHEITGADGGALALESRYAHLSDEDLDREIAERVAKLGITVAPVSE